MNIPILTLMLVIFFVIYFKEKNSEVLLQKIMFNIPTVIYFIIGIVLLFVTNLFDFLKYAILFLYALPLIFHLFDFICIKGLIFIIHLFSKKTKEADKNYKLSINMLPIICYGYILIVNYLLW